MLANEKKLCWQKQLTNTRMSDLGKTEQSRDDSVGKRGVHVDHSKAEGSLSETVPVETLSPPPAGYKVRTCAHIYAEAEQRNNQPAGWLFSPEACTCECF